MNEQAAANVQASRFGAWLDHHGFSIVAGLGRLLRKPGATLLTVGVMAVALALPLGLWVVMQNLQRLGGEVQSSRDVAVFLKPEIDAARAQAIADTLRGRGDVANVELIAPEPVSYTHLDVYKRQRSSSAGAIILHGPHQGAQKSTSTGWSEASTWLSKSASVACRTVSLMRGSNGSRHRSKGARAGDDRMMGLHSAVTKAGAVPGMTSPGISPGSLLGCPQFMQVRIAASPGTLCQSAGGRPMSDKPLTDITFDSFELHPLCLLYTSRCV